MNLCGNGGRERPYGRKETGATVCEDGRPILTYVAEDSKMSCNIITAVYTVGESAASTCEVGIASGIEPANKVGSRMVSVYNVNGMRTDNASKGLRIEKMSDGTVRKVVVK